MSPAADVPESILGSIDSRLAGIERSIERQHDENIEEHRRLFDLAEREHRALHDRISKLQERHDLRLAALEQYKAVGSTKWSLMGIGVSTIVAAVVTLLISALRKL